jgi:hypothetical protein
MGWDQQVRHTRIFVQFVVFWAALQSWKHVDQPNGRKGASHE